MWPFFGAVVERSRIITRTVSVTKSASFFIELWVSTPIIKIVAIDEYNLL